LTIILHPKYILERPLHFIATIGHALKALEEAKKTQARQKSLCIFFSSPSEMVLFGVGLGFRV
jgi:hypothetical protein